MKQYFWHFVLTVLSCCLLCSEATGQVIPAFEQFKTGIAPNELAVLVNTLDPQSVAVATYFRQQYHIPLANVIEISISQAEISSDGMIGESAFNNLKAQVDQRTPAAVQAYAISWTLPYRVLKEGSAACNGVSERDCMSITSAFAFGFDPAHVDINFLECSSQARNPYFGSDSRAPYTDLGIRPAMMIAGVNEEQAKAVIDRGVASHGSNPAGTGYFVRSSDSVRAGVRSHSYVSLTNEFQSSRSNIATLLQDNSSGGLQNYVEGRNDVLFYVVDVTSVAFISNGTSTNTFLPGSVAEHLTSFAGQIHRAPGSGQMTLLRWLEAGATGSYGTVVEPTTIPGKFTNLTSLLRSYFSGATLIEAYWKSVLCPGEGLFVGDPLASPWGSPLVTLAGTTMTIETSALQPGETYMVYSINNSSGSIAHVLGGIAVASLRRHKIAIENVSNALSYYLVPTADAPPSSPGDSIRPSAPSNFRIN